MLGVGFLWGRRRPKRLLGASRKTQDVSLRNTRSDTNLIQEAATGTGPPRELPGRANTIELEGRVNTVELGGDDHD